MTKGNHIAVRRGSVVHHGLECGNDCVLEFEGSSVDGKPVRLVTFDGFTEGHTYTTVACADLLDADFQVWLAMNRLFDVALWGGPAEPTRLAA